MSHSSASARKAAYWFLAVCCGALLALGGYKAYEEFGPSKVSVEAVPFGLPSAGSVARGDTPDLNAGVSSLPVQTQAELRRAVELSHGGNYQAAIEIFESIVMIYPDILKVQWEELNTLFEKDSLSEREDYRMKQFAEMLKARYPGGVAVYIESRLAARASNTTLAIQLAQVAAEKAPALYDARLWFAKLLLRDGRLAQAAAESRTAISLSAGADPRAYEIMAKLYHDQGQLDSCSAVVEYALTQFPVNMELHLLQGYLAEYRGHFDAADRIYQRILALDPNFKKASEAEATLGEKSPPGTGTAVNLTPRDRAQMAVDILAPLVERYPENLPLREALGLSYLKGREFDRARAQFQEILNRDPEYPDIRLRLQESNVTKPAPVSAADGLAANLNRALDSIKGTNAPSKEHDFTTMLGHYLVRYGATPGEFFKKYAIGNFRPIKTNVWQETFYEGTYKHTYTVVFDSLNHFREVHVVVSDSSVKSNHLGMAPEIFTRLLKQNSRISGIGSSTGETDCGDSTVLDASVWETQDNFEILARVVGKPSEIRMVRFDKTALPPGLKLCDYIPYLKEF
ncbi:MAG: tetratricopeptide repeat protein [Fibrobacter sp.]|jgi:tetratricopeptide (TPR) repeat protein|nr:tetratricopeptide repeat protein [Fibrobacter sp.]